MVLTDKERRAPQGLSHEGPTSKELRRRIGLTWQWFRRGSPLVIGAFVVAIPMTYVIVVITNSNPSAQQLSVASQAIIQFDSFLTAGWTAGFFFFWKSFSEELTAFGWDISGPRVEKLAERFSNMIVQLTKTGVEGAASELQAIIADLFKIQEEAIPGNLLSVGYFIALGALLNYVLSGLFAVVTILTGDVAYFSTSVILLVIGLGLTVTGWFILRYLTDLFRVFRTLMTSTVEKTKSKLDDASKRASAPHDLSKPT